VVTATTTVHYAVETNGFRCEKATKKRVERVLRS